MSATGMYPEQVLDGVHLQTPYQFHVLAETSTGKSNIGAAICAEAEALDAAMVVR
jgi:hypothetical protein